MRSSSNYLALTFSLSISSLSPSVLAATIERSENNFVFDFNEGNYFEAGIGAQYGYIDNF